MRLWHLACACRQSQRAESKKPPLRWLNIVPVFPGCQTVSPGQGCRRSSALSSRTPGRLAGDLVSVSAGGKFQSRLCDKGLSALILLPCITAFVRLAALYMLFHKFSNGAIQRIASVPARPVAAVISDSSQRASSRCCSRNWGSNFIRPLPLHT